MKLKILLLTDAASFHSQRIAKQYFLQDCEVLTLSLEEGEMEYRQLKRKGQLRSLHYFRTVPEIKKIIDEFKPDVINAHFASGYGHIAALAKRSFNIPLVTNLWGSDILLVPDKSFMHRRKTVYALKNADYIIGDSQYLIDAAKKLYDFSSSDVIPWGIEREYLKFHKDNYDLLSPLKIIVPRHHEAVYNNRFIVESLLDLINNESVSLTFPAFGSQYESFKSFCDEKSNGKVEFYEKKSRKEFLEYMSSFDVYLSASLSDSSPVSLIESMALGLIPVAGMIDGVKEWLSDKNGFPFVQSDKQSLIDSIVKIIHSDNKYDEIRISNINKVKSEAIFEDNIARQISIMNTLVNEGNSQ